MLMFSAATPGCDDRCLTFVSDPSPEEAGLHVHTSLTPLQRFAWNVHVELVMVLDDGSEAVVPVFEDHAEFLDLTSPNAQDIESQVVRAPLPEERAFILTVQYPTAPLFGTEPGLEFHAWMEQPGVRSPPDPVPAQMRITLERSDAGRRFSCVTSRFSHEDYERRRVTSTCGDQMMFWSLDTTCEWQIVP